MKYGAYGLILDTDFPLPDLPSLEEGPAEVTIRSAEASTSPFLSPPRSAWSASPFEIVIPIEGVATFRIRGGQEITVEPSAGASPEDVAFFLVESAMQAILMQRGHLVLQASAVNSPEGVLLILGRAAVGKSTLAMGLGHRGFPFFCDGPVAIYEEGGQMWARPSVPFCRLWKTSVSALALDPEGALPTLRPGLAGYPDSRLRKYRVPLAAWTAKPRPIAGLCFLGSKPSPEVESNPFSKPDTLDSLRFFTYQKRFLMAQGWLAERLQLAALLTNAVAKSRLFCYPKSWPRLGEALDRFSSEFSPARENRKRANTPTQAEKPVRLGYVWLASYPKSGNTWVRALLSAWLAPGKSNLDTLETWPSLNERQDFEETMGLDSGLLDAQELLMWRSRYHTMQAGSLAGQTVIKVHEPFEKTSAGEPLFPPEATAGAIYVIRSPLDVAISYSHHFQVSIDTAIDHMADRDNYIIDDDLSRIQERIGCWSQHVSSWMAPLPYPRICVRYENLHKDPRGELKKISDFLNLEWNEQLAEQVLQQTTFKRLQEAEQRQGFAEKPVNSTSFFRVGTAGQWRTVLTPAQARKIVHTHGKVMRQFGYAAQVDEVNKLPPSS